VGLHRSDLIDIVLLAVLEPKLVVSTPPPRRVNVLKLVLAAHELSSTQDVHLDREDRERKGRKKELAQWINGGEKGGRRVVEVEVEGENRCCNGISSYPIIFTLPPFLWQAR